MEKVSRRKTEGGEKGKRGGEEKGRKEGVWAGRRVRRREGALEVLQVGRAEQIGRICGCVTYPRRYEFRGVGYELVAFIGIA